VASTLVELGLVAVADGRSLPFHCLLMRAEFGVTLVPNTPQWSSELILWFECLIFSLGLPHI
jgi:hypothetical protein